GAETPTPPSVLIGDATLRGKLRLDDLTREGDALVAPIAGGGKAILTLDPALQEAAESVLARAKAPMGAIVVTSLDGRVLAYAGLRDGGESPRRDLGRCGAVWAPAASVFKIVTSAALLAKGVKPGDKVCYHGGLRSVDPAHLVDDPKRDTVCESL